MDVIGSYDLDPNYGGGVFNRRIKLVQSEGCLNGELEDCNHGFRVSVHHHNGVITDIKPEFKRIPFTSCGGAEEPLRELIGMPLGASISALIQRAAPVKNCTHLYDLTLWTIQHSQREEDEVIFDVVVTDAVEGVSNLTVSRNGVVQHDWQAKNGYLLSPESLEGKSLFKGFYQWVNETFSSLELEAALVLQKGNLVSIGRMIDLASLTGGRAIDETERHACHTYSPDNNKTAIRLADTERDFTDTPENLLRFL